MNDQYLNPNQLRRFAADSPILAFRPHDTGSPQEDWCNHLRENERYRRELEEFSILGAVVVRIADGIEPEPFERIKILSLEYAVKTLKDETDAREFVRCVKAIASPDADQWEFEQIATFYYKEIRRQPGQTGEVLKEMGLLGMEMEAVSATIRDREFEVTETQTEEQKLTVAEQRKVRSLQTRQRPLPASTPNFDNELAAAIGRVRSSKTTRLQIDDFAEFYLRDEDKSLEELDADHMSFEKLEQYDENGIIGFSMSGGQHSVITYQLNLEVDDSYLPNEVGGLAKEMKFIFVGHEIGGAAAQKARQFVLEQRLMRNEMHRTKRGSKTVATAIPPVKEFSNLPFSEEDFSEWLEAKLSYHYPDRTLRNVRRMSPDKTGKTKCFRSVKEVNPDFAEMQYVASVCRILWMNMKGDFFLRSLRNRTYQQFHFNIRKCEDTADIAVLKKQAYAAFKELRKLSLKEFTALVTAAKSQEARLASKLSGLTRKTLQEIGNASIRRVRYFKYFLYNDAAIHKLPRQEKQRLWDSVRKRETRLLNTEKIDENARENPVQKTLFQMTSPIKPVVTHSHTA